MATVEFERTHCGRCGGSGHYSYNQINGTVCFGCNGSGKQLSKRGRAAREFASAMLATTLDKVGSRRGKIRTAFGAKIIFTGVMVVEKSGVILANDGQQHTMYEPVVNGKPCGTVFSGSVEVQLIPTEEQIAEIKAFQDSLADSGEPRAPEIEYDADGEPILIDYDDKF